MRKIKKGDEVIVTTGKDKGRRGEVVRVLADEEKVVVANVNMVKRHTKPNPQRGVSGGIIEKEMPVHISNVALYNRETGKGDRVGVRMEGDKKVRFFKSTNKLVDA